MKKYGPMLALALLSVVPARGDTQVSGTISANTTWTLAGSPYILTGDVHVAGSASPVLTIEAGVVVKANAGSQILVNHVNRGGLVAIGTAAAPILFTSNAATPAAGSWYGIHFGSYGGGPSSSISYATVEYGGGASISRGGITVMAAAPAFANVTARNSAYAGVAVHGGTPSFDGSTLRGNPSGVIVHGGAPVFRNSTIADNTGPGVNTVGSATVTLDVVAVTGNSGAALTLHPMTQLGGVTGLTASGNGLNAIEYRAGEMSASRTWPTCPLPYVVTGSLYVRHSSAPILTIEPGNTIRFNAASQIAVNYNNRGGLAAHGTPTAPILFTSNAATPAPGSWYGLYFGSYSGGTPSSVSHATVEYGGIVSSERGGITVMAGTPSFSNVTTRNNLHSGVAVHGGAPSFDSSSVRANPIGVILYGGAATWNASTIADNSGPGIRTEASTTLTLTDLAITGNSGAALTLHPMTQLGGVSGLTTSGNGLNAIEYRAGEMSASRTWPTCPLPYVVTGSLYVRHSSAPILTIEPGNTIRFNAASQIAVNYNNRGGLSAHGTPTAPILFTSNAATPAPGSWYGLYFGSYSGGTPSSVSHATVEYGGIVSSERGGITVMAGTPSFSNVTTRNNVHSGVAIHGGAPSFEASSVQANPIGVIQYGGSSTWTASAIANNSGPGIRTEASTTLTLTNLAITGNSGAALTLHPMTQLGSVTGLTTSGNGLNAIEYRAGEISASRTWPTCPLPYVVTGSLYVRHSSAPILTIEPGNTIRFNAASQIAVNYNNKGGLSAHGTPTAPILFTSNAATPAPGSWYGLYFGSYSGGTQSSVSHATVEYGGIVSSERGGITVMAGTPSFSNVTTRNNLHSGVAVHGGAPSFDSSSVRANPIGVILYGGSATWNASTIADNSGPGIRTEASATLTLTDLAITGNGGAALTLETMTQLGVVSGLTANGNGLDAVEYRAGEMSASRTWPTCPLPYVVAGSLYVRHSSAPILTIEPGNTIRFSANSQLLVNHQNKGGLSAHGTPTAPIVFTSNAATPTPGSWYGIFFGNYSGGTPSSVSYATIEYGGLASASRGGLTVTGGTPAFDRLTIRNNAYAGLSVTGGRPRIESSQFSGNPAGVRTSGSAVVDAPLNYWDAAEGPCLAGSCAAGQQSVTTAVLYEPWLMTVQTEVHYVADVVQKDRTFSPAIGAQTSVDYTTSLPGDVTMTVRDQSGTPLRTLILTGTPGSLSWDGRNGSGVVQPDGTYTYELAAVAPNQPPAAVARGRAVLDSTRALTITQPSTVPAFFSPNGDGVQDAVTVTASSNYENLQWTVTAVDPGGTVVRQHTGSGLPISYTWDGADSAAAVQPDALYTLRVDVTVGTAAAQASATATLDNTPATLAILRPAVGEVQSNVHTGGGYDFVVTGTATDAHLLNWTLQVGSGAAPSSWTNLGSGTTSVADANLGTWRTATNPNGDYSLRLQGSDRAGNPAVVTNYPVPLGHFKVAQNAYQFNVGTGGTLTYTSTVPFALEESIVVKNEAGAVVRNLVTASSRAAGAYSDVFDGRNDSGVLLPDGPYFYVATVTDGTHTLVWDLSSEYRFDYSAFNDSLVIPAYDPFNNKPMKFSYNFAKPGRLTIATSTNSGSVKGDCLAPTSTFFCPVYNRWEESGLHTFTWSGIDHTGRYRPIRSAAIVMLTGGFPKNAAVMFGTKPAVTNVKVTPPVFGPAVGTQQVEFDLTTYQGGTADVSIAFVSLANASTLRTLAIPAQTPGHVTATWDGRADNEMLIAPGRYAVVVTVTDTLGNVVKGDILTTIKY